MYTHKVHRHSEHPRWSFYKVEGPGQTGPPGILGREEMAVWEACTQGKEEPMSKATENLLDSALWVKTQVLPAPDPGVQILLLQF